MKKEGRCAVVVVLVMIEGHDVEVPRNCNKRRKKKRVGHEEGVLIKAADEDGESPRPVLLTKRRLPSTIASSSIVAKRCDWLGCEVAA
jgi:hypothetical protein